MTFSNPTKLTTQPRARNQTHTRQAAPHDDAPEGDASVLEIAGADSPSRRKVKLGELFFSSG